MLYQMGVYCAVINVQCSASERSMCNELQNTYALVASR